MPEVARATEAGIQIFTVGIGNASKSGERIPLPGEDQDEVRFKKDQTGNLVITQLDEETLKAIAKTGNGSYYRVSDAGTELIEIYRSLSANEETEFKSRQQRLQEDRYQYPLLAGIIFLAAAYSLGTRSFKKLRRTQQGVVT
jgi:Ca-activated chloride channel family protein